MLSNESNFISNTQADRVTSPGPTPVTEDQMEPHRVDTSTDWMVHSSVCNTSLLSDNEIHFSIIYINH